MLRFNRHLFKLWHHADFGLLYHLPCPLDGEVEVINVHIVNAAVDESEGMAMDFYDEPALWMTGDEGEDVARVHPCADWHAGHVLIKHKAFPFAVVGATPTLPPAICHEVVDLVIGEVKGDCVCTDHAVILLAWAGRLSPATVIVAESDFRVFHKLYSKLCSLGVPAVRIWVYKAVCLLASPTLRLSLAFLPVLKAPLVPTNSFCHLVLGLINASYRLLSAGSRCHPSASKPVTRRSWNVRFGIISFLPRFG
jgi:hypothetical protein